MNRKPLGIGLIGAGPVAQAIHVPTLLRLRDRFAVRSVMDIDAAIADAVAGRVGCRSTTSIDELLEDPTVDVVAICSPDRFHATQVIQAIRAGKRAVLCEKPFATSVAEAKAIAEAGAAAGVPVFVGAMHTADPAWLTAQRVWGDLPETTHTVRSRIALPQNKRYEDWATELLGRPAGRPQDLSDPVVQAAMFVNGMLGLASHNLPLVRAFLPDFAAVRVEHAQFIAPFGYLAVLRAGERQVQLTGLIHGRWNPQWTFDALAPDASLHIDFTPSFVHAGSGVATLRTSEVATVYGPYPRNGYQSEWERLADAVNGAADVAPPLQSLIDDITFVLGIAEQAAAIITREKAA